MALNEVAPPGWGHTKAEKEKTKPDKPKSKIGGSAAAFKRALDDGRFKGLPGDKTKKEKTASMFKLMWSMKKKGAKPHYKPGTDEKKKKYQDEDWKPEIEHSKLGDAVKKKREKKRKEAESSLPPHLRLDAMKKAFAHTNEEASYKQRDKELKKTKKAMDYRHKTIHKGGDEDVNEGASIIQGGKSRKKVSYRGPTAEKSRPKKSVSYRGEKDERIPVLNRKGKENKSARYASQLHRLRPASERMGKKKVDEALTPMQDNNLFGNAYAKLKKKIGSKKKHNKPAIQEGSFKDYMAQAQAARDREKKRREDRKKSDAQYSDTRKHGVRFYDKKGKGRIKSGKKIYD